MNNNNNNTYEWNIDTLRRSVRSAIQRLEECKNFLDLDDYVEAEEGIPQVLVNYHVKLCRNHVEGLLTTLRAVTPEQRLLEAIDEGKHKWMYVSSKEREAINGYYRKLQLQREKTAEAFEAEHAEMLADIERQENE